ncbi:MAG: MXAN_5187 C-terminal domain-containing protein [Polyangiaceae bacterium]
MRNKIIAVNAAIVVLIGILAFALVRGALVSASSNTAQMAAAAKRDAQSASARLQLDGLRMERWLATKAREPATLEVLAKASPAAVADAATSLCDAVLAAAKQSSVFQGAVPSLVVLIDAQGKTLGRNGSNLGRGDDLGALYPSLKQTLAAGSTGSDVWFNTGRNDQYLASYAPVRDETGKLVGAIAAGFTLNDELSRVAESLTGKGVKLVMPQGDNLQVVASSPGASEDLAQAINGAAKANIKNAIASGSVSAGEGTGKTIVSASPIEGFGDGKRVAVVAAVPSSLLEDISGMLMPLIGGATILGIIMVTVAGWLLGGYITGPITTLEEGLLQILNGQTDKRFQLDHPDLGGLAYRIDQLLNQLMGIEEDTTDEEGRVSKAPTAANFSDAMSVDRGGGGGDGAEGMDAAAIQALANEPAEAYYARIYREYIAAKRGLGEAVDHITDAAFRQRIQSMEQDASSKYGKPVRYRVQARGREVVLLAIPL